MANLFFMPFTPAFQLAGGIAGAATLTFYYTGTDTLAPIKNDAGDALANPLYADAFGRFPSVYMDPSIIYRVILKNAIGVVLGDVDPYTVPISIESFDDGIWNENDIPIDDGLWG